MSLMLTLQRAALYFMNQSSLPGARGKINLQRKEVDEKCLQVYEDSDTKLRRTLWEQRSLIHL